MKTQSLFPKPMIRVAAPKPELAQAAAIKHCGHIKQCGHIRHCGA